MKLINKILNFLFGIKIGKEAKEELERLEAKRKEERDKFYSIEKAAEILYRKPSIVGNVEHANVLWYNTITDDNLPKSNPNFWLKDYWKELSGKPYLREVNDRNMNPGFVFAEDSLYNFARQIEFELAPNTNEEYREFNLKLETRVDFYTLTYEDDVPNGIYDYPVSVNFVLDEKARKEFPQALIKAKNLCDRFAGILKRIILVPLNENNEYETKKRTISSIGFAIEYELLDETKFFMAYYKSNLFKKKLNGAAITLDELTKNYCDAVNRINSMWKEHSSKLHLSCKVTCPSKLSLNGRPIFAGTNKSPCELMKTVLSDDFYQAMERLLDHDVYMVKTGEESQIVMDPTVNSSGIIEFKPVFKTDTAVLAVSAAVTKLNSRSSYERTI